MIRVNLLIEGRKKRKKKKPFPVIIVLCIILTLITIAGSGGYFYYLKTEIASLKQERANKDKELAKLKEQVKEVDQYEKDNQLLADKTKIIEQLKKNQKGPVRIIDELSKKLPDGLWFESVDDKSGTISLSGKAFSNGSLVTFVQNLKASEITENVTLLESKKTSIDDVTVYQFKLNFKVKV